MSRFAEYGPENSAIRLFRGLANEVAVYGKDSNAFDFAVLAEAVFYGDPYTRAHLDPIWKECMRRIEDREHEKI